MAADVEVTTVQSVVPTDEELLVRIGAPILSAVFAAVGEVCGVVPTSILKSMPKGRSKMRPVIFEARQLVIHTLIVDLEWRLEEVSRLFAVTPPEMAGKCRGIVELASTDSGLSRKIKEVRAKLREFLPQ